MTDFFLWNGNSYVFHYGATGEGKWVSEENYNNNAKSALENYFTSDFKWSNYGFRPDVPYSDEFDKRVAKLGIERWRSTGDFAPGPVSGKPNEARNPFGVQRINTEDNVTFAVVPFGTGIARSAITASLFEEVAVESGITNALATGTDEAVFWSGIG